MLGIHFCLCALSKTNVLLSIILCILHSSKTSLFLCNMDEYSDIIDIHDSIFQVKNSENTNTVCLHNLNANLFIDIFLIYNLNYALEILDNSLHARSICLLLSQTDKCKL